MTQMELTDVKNSLQILAVSSIGANIATEANGSQILKTTHTTALSFHEQVDVGLDVLTCSEGCLEDKLSLPFWLTNSILEPHVVVHLVDDQIVLGEEGDEALFGGVQEDNGLTGLSRTSGSTTSMDVLGDFGWSIILNDPVHGGDIQTTSRHIRANECGNVTLDELSEVLQTLVLRHVAMKTQNTSLAHLSVHTISRPLVLVQQLNQELDAVARVDKDQHFALGGLSELLSQEGQQGRQLQTQLDVEIVLLELLRHLEDVFILLLVALRFCLVSSRQLGLLVQGWVLLQELVCIDEDIVTQSGLNQLCDGRRQGGRQQDGLGMSVSSVAHSAVENAHQLRDLGLESHIQQAISFIQNDIAEVVHLEGGGVQNMIQETAWSSNDDVAAFPQSRLLALALLATANDGRDDVVVGLQQHLQDILDLHTEFSCGNENDGVGSALASDGGSDGLEEVRTGGTLYLQFLDDRNQIGQRLAGAGLGLDHGVLALQEHGDARVLHQRGDLQVHIVLALNDFGLGNRASDRQRYQLGSDVHVVEGVGGEN